MVGIGRSVGRYGGREGGSDGWRFCVKIATLP